MGKHQAIAVVTSMVWALMGTTPALGSDLSPASWPVVERERAEQREAVNWAPAAARTISGQRGVVSAIASPIAVQAGIETLKKGGSAADAAATVALSEIATQLGSVVSYAGIMSVVYFDSKAGQVYSLDAGYNTYLNENDPASIPVADMGPMNSAVDAVRAKVKTPTKNPARGRETLVPGFMAGVEALHARFGRLRFADLFEPAIWYAEHGVIVNPPLAGCFMIRHEFLMRTPEGRQFLHQAGSERPQLGGRFIQLELAKTLRGVAREGARYMYTGPWGQEFVKTINREGGKVTIDDMKRYRATWSDPLSTTFAGHRVVTAGVPGLSAYYLLPALNLAEERNLAKRPFYWQAPDALRDLERIVEVIDGAPELDPGVATFLRAKGIDITPAAQLQKTFAKAVAPLLDQLASAPRNGARHSNSVVVVDRAGNIAAMTHSINSVIWGDTGIVVGGVPIPDSAGFQQARLATIKPGARVPHEMMQSIVFPGEKPVLATAAIGSSGFPETLKIILGAIGQSLDLKTLQAAPPLIYNFMAGQPGQSAIERGLVVPKEAYGAAFLKELESAGLNVTKISSSLADGLRGTVAAVEIDPATGERQTVETSGVLIFGGAE